ncbi:MAG: hypothetical protein DRN15_08870 [Thermoprotei archaeon]|nr:MAG: hypothetical protein DRM97_07925 [Thermoprotei archaeon]RLF22466.1 MAG: hypothetical protein DRN15_08870 [Thermoprotei archaeon]
MARIDRRCAPEDVIKQVSDELRRHGHEPRVIGEVEGRGHGTLKVTADVASLIAQPSLLSELEVIK